MEFSEKIKNLLKDKGLTQVEFAAAAGMNYAHANKFILGHRAPSMDFIQNIVKVFPDVDLNWLLLPQREHKGVYRLGEENGSYANQKALDYIQILEDNVNELKQLLTHS